MRNFIIEIHRKDERRDEYVTTKFVVGAKGDLPPAIVKWRVAGKVRLFARHMYSNDYYEATPVALTQSNMVKLK